MAQNQVKDTDIAVLIAAIQSSVGPIQVDAEKVAKHLGMSLSSIPPKFTAIRKRYNIDIKVVNSGALQRNRQHSPKKRLSGHGPKPVRNVNTRTQSGNECVMELPEGLVFEPAVVAKHESP
ncbi:uncharacterized protein Z520_04860 [Fonsecaea multimorphosa CBS 102226]|uniref:Uncharacterized protein n=1 Tax=Fonsecaea multimorphosa CBS 102226 TaxID=1442371 RepID=A0A0D2K801_9EURO|nr:uncharacterized protein Z520_04860 [Fonsecaea multimorphosa CBS 102226]KIX99284.1 hypothetical protein Z520_04860 [Fonsecaea multimorphosa CBS 102226]OAL25974.1 hypothetical protein AYO22_04601 [Fonsecaea multimorphosa]